MTKAPSSRTLYRRAAAARAAQPAPEQQSEGPYETDLGVIIASVKRPDGPLLTTSKKFTAAGKWYSNELDRRNVPHEVIATLLGFARVGHLYGAVLSDGQ